MLAQRGIKPEALPAAEDIKKLERRVKSEKRNLPKARDLRLILINLHSIKSEISLPIKKWYCMIRVN